MSSSPQARLKCPGCESVLVVPVEQLGKAVKCGRCEQTFLTAAPAAGPTPPAPAPVADDNPFAIPGDAEGDGPRPAPERKAAAARSATGKPAKLGLIIGAAVLGLLILGGAAAGVRYALKDREVAKATEPARAKDAAKPREKPAEKAKPAEPATTPDGRMLDATRERIKASTAYIRVLYGDGKGSSGSGFFTARPGLVVTNAHVIGLSRQTGMKKAARVEVVTDSGLPTSTAHPARVLKADVGLDLALLQIEAAGPPALEVIDSFQLKETQPVYIFGFPGGENLGTNISVNVSTISSLRRDDVVPWVQVAGGMHPGNSGGPVTDAAGRVVGVARAVVVGTQINMAIPGDIVHSFLNNAADVLPGKGGGKDDR